MIAIGLRKRFLPSDLESRLVEALQPQEQEADLDGSARSLAEKREHASESVGNDDSDSYAESLNDISAGDDGSVVEGDSSEQDGLNRSSDGDGRDADEVDADTHRSLRTSSSANDEVILPSALRSSRVSSSERSSEMDADYDEDFNDTDTAPVTASRGRDVGSSLSSPEPQPMTGVARVADALPESSDTLVPRGIASAAAVTAVQVENAPMRFERGTGRMRAQSRALADLLLARAHRAVANADKARAAAVACSYDVRAW
jgi:hypothetical protein